MATTMLHVPLCVCFQAKPIELLFPAFPFWLCGLIHSELVYEFCKIMCDRWEGGSEDEHNRDFLGFCNLEAARAAGIWAS